MNNEISLTIKPTNACNMRCKHCYHAAEGFDEKCIPSESVLKFIDMAAKEYNKINILLHGGEPTILGKNYFYEIFEYEHKLEQEGITFTNTVQTNGVLLDDDFCELFQNNNVNLGISFDGPNNSILREYTERVLNNLQMMQKKNYKAGILCVETQKTISNLIDTYEWFKKNGFGYKIIPIFNYGNASDNQEFLLDANMYADEMIKLYEYWLHDRKCNIRVNTLEEFTLLFCPDYNIHFGQSCICHRLCINPDGKIYPCGRPYSEEFFLGHITEVMTIQEIFSSANYRKIIDLSISRYRNCKAGCRYHSICRGGCISNSILDGSYEQIDGEACKKYKYLYERIEPINQILYRDMQDGKENLYNPRAVRRIKKYINQKQM